MEASTRSLIARKKAAQSVANEWREILDDAYEYAIPQRNTINRTAAGQKKGNKIYDSTAVSATMNFANRIQSDMMPPSQKWVELTLGKGLDEELEDEAREILQEVSERLQSVMAVSNFDSANNEMLIDLATGTGAMLIQAGDDRMPVRYSSIPIAQLSLEEGANDTISGIYRTYSVKARNIQATWSDAVIPASIVRLLSEKKADAEVELIECSYYDEEDDVWRYDIIYEKEAVRLLSRTSKESPIVVTRWAKVSGETFGRGVLVQALPDIKTLNALTKMILQNASLAISGAYMVADDGVVNPNTLKISAGAFIPVSRTAGVNGATIAPIPRSGDFSVGELERERLIQSIRRMLFDEALPPQTGAVRSATEIIERVKELSRTIGAPFGRLMSEFITPMIRRTLEVMVEKELIEHEISIDGTIVQVNVNSPLVQNQNISDVENVIRWVEIMNSTLGEDAVAMGVKTEDLPEYIGEKLGVPQDLIRSKEQRREIMQEAEMQRRNEANQQASQVQAATGIEQEFNDTEGA